jgi:hypothetical protein
MTDEFTKLPNTEDREMHRPPCGDIVRHVDDGDSSLTNFFAGADNVQSSPATVIGTTMGMLADIGGSIGTINLIISLVKPRPEVSTEIQGNLTAMAATLQQTMDHVVPPARAAQESSADRRCRRHPVGLRPDRHGSSADHRERLRRCARCPVAPGPARRRRTAVCSHGLGKTATVSAAVQCRAQPRRPRS